MTTEQPVIRQNKQIEQHETFQARVPYVCRQGGAEAEAAMTIHITMYEVSK